MNRYHTFCTGRDCTRRPSFPVYVMNPAGEMKQDCKLYKEIQK